MRYLGNKSSINDTIQRFIQKVIIDRYPENDFTFFDAFCGTASVSDYVSNEFNVIANDSMYYAYVYARGRLNIPDMKFSGLGFSPFEYFNSNDLRLIYDGFIYLNYSKGGSERMYFSEENAAKIDSIRTKIQFWKEQQKINDKEYFYLLACLLESVSKVANIAGVYGAYLKQWDSRALKNMEFIPVETLNANNVAYVYNDDIQDIIEKINCDILYIDPPYTKNQYSTQYHILETIAKYDYPSITGVTGTRKNKVSSFWSKDGYAHVEFEKIIKKTNAKHIIVSYSSLGIMEKKYIELVLKRYGKPETFTIEEIPYKKYKNHKTKSHIVNYEYLFYIEKKEKDIFYTSPLNYMGSKEKLNNFLFEYIPNNISTFYDIFGGGFNVGINAPAKKVIYNDNNFKVKELIEMFRNENISELYKFVKKTIKQYGLEKNNKEAYLKLRTIYNHPEPPLRDPKLLYVLILFGFQQQIRFNANHEFNNPVGESNFNANIEEKLISFSAKIKETNVQFFSDDFSEFVNFDANDFVYCDPPYLITLGSYNDGKRGFTGWTETEEKRLLEYLSMLNENNIKFMLSNVLEHKGEINKILTKWIKENEFKVIHSPKSKARKEVIIINY